MKYLAKHLKFSTIFVLIFLLSGCNAVRNLDKSDEYKNTPAHDKTIVLPKNTKTNIIEDHYPVPKAKNSNFVGVSTTPPGSNLAE